MFSFWKKAENQKDSSILSTKIDALLIKEQLEKQIQILCSVGIIEKSESGELSILGIDNKRYLLPPLEELYKKVIKKQDLIKIKMTQGFDKIILVPFACPFDEILKKYEKLLLKHYDYNTIFATKEKETDINEKLELDKTNPFNVWSDFREADKKGELIYFPKTFNRTNHEGKTKSELLLSDEEAWQIFLIEDTVNIKGINTAKTIKGRKQIEAGKSPNEYLKILQTKKEYEEEKGLSPEGELIYAITKLEETNQVVNDWQGKGNISYALGAFFVSSEDIPWLSWDRDFKRADLWKANPWNTDPHIGTRFGIKI